MADTSSPTPEIPLTGPEKAAAFMLSLPTEQLSKIFEKMEQNEISEISQAMSNLGKVKPGVMELVFKEFTDSLGNTGTLVGTSLSTERLLAKVLDKDRVKSIMNEIRGPEGRTVWDKLSGVAPDALANFLKNEHPQTAAFILSKIKFDHASKVFTKLNEDFVREMIERMLRMDTVSREVMINIENTLKNTFMGNISKSSQKDAHEIIANIFNTLDRTTETKYMTFLEEKLPESAEKVRSLMFTFDDVGGLNNTGIQTVIKFADKKSLVLALKGAADNIKNLFFSNMSERAAKMMREDLEALGAVRLKEVSEAQLDIVNLTKDLASKGEIVILEDDEDSEMVD